MQKGTQLEMLGYWRGRYSGMINRKERGICLTSFCEQTGLERKYAQKLLSGRRDGTGAGRRKATGRPRKYTEEDKEIIRQIWLLTNQYCAVRLKAALALWLPAYSDKVKMVGEESRKRIMGISASQIERFIRDFRVRQPRMEDWRKGRSQTAVKAQIEVRAERWNVDSPGWLEADCVALCGGNMGGEFIWLLTVTDVWSGWTEIRPMWNRSARKVIDHYGDMEACTPFAWKGIDTDNGGEFISWEVLEWQQLREVMGKQLHLTRSRPYYKNDQAYVEEKNYTLGREFFGYERYGHQQTMDMMEELCRCWSLYNNLYRPTLKQVSRVREGCKVRRKHEKTAKTPAQRIMEHPGTPESVKHALADAMQRNSPLEMAKACESGLRTIWKATREMDAVPPYNQLGRDEIANRYGKLNLRYAPIELAISEEKS